MSEEKEETGIEQIINLKEDGSFSLDMSYFSYPARLVMHSNKFVKEFGQPRVPESEITTEHENLAASLQKVLEEAVLNLINHVQKVTKQTNSGTRSGQK